MSQSSARLEVLCDQPRSQRIEQSARRDTGGTARSRGSDQGTCCSRPQCKLQRLLLAACINTDNRLMLDSILQAAQQRAGCLAAKRQHPRGV